MGYLTEGITTYYGDLMLKRSGVFNTSQYLKQINKTLERHFFNYGAQNMSVADSSFDTWIDGYERGIPNRKSSIYTEGCLLAFVCYRFFKELRHHNAKSSNDKIAKIEVSGSERSQLLKALTTITIADVSMSIDNVVAVAAIARENTSLLIFGLVVAIAFMAFFATMIMRLMTRYSWLSWLGLLFLIYLTYKMLHDGLPEIILLLT